jgi:tetratricopeptide (TPR) repeat protein
MVWSNFKPICNIATVLLTATISALFIAGCGTGNTPKTENKTMSKAQNLLVKADSIFKSGKYAESRGIYQQALKEAESANNNSDQTEALSMIARSYLILDDKETGYDWINKAEAKANNDEELGWSRYLGVKGRFLWQDKKNDEATLMFQDMYNYCSERKLHERAIDAAHMVAIAGTSEQQIEWGKKGIKEAEEGNIGSWLGPLWNNLGWTYEDTKQYDSSLAAYLKARDYHYQHGTDRNKVIADWAVGHAYVNLKDYENADKWMRPLLAKFEEMEDGEFTGFTCRELGEIELANNNYQAAHDMFDRSEKLLKEAGMDEWDADGYKKIVDRMEETKAKIE